MTSISRYLGILNPALETLKQMEFLVHSPSLILPAASQSCLPRLLILVPNDKFKHIYRLT